MSTKLLLLTLLLSFISCNTSKNTVEENSKEEPIINTQANEALVKEGYSLGIMKYIEDSGCSFIIIDKETDTKFDPINIEEKRFIAFRKDSIHIYYKFRRLRRAPRCNSIQPIELIDIKKEKH